MRFFLYKHKPVLVLVMLLLCQAATVFSYNGLRSSYREYRPLLPQLNSTGDFNNYIQTADSMYNNNGKLDGYGEALCAATVFLRQNNKYGFVRFADYLAKLGYPMDIDNILRAIQTDKIYGIIPEITRPPQPDSIEGLLALRREYMKDIKRMDSLVENFQAEFSQKFIRGKDLFTALNEMDKETRLALWAQENIRRCENGRISDTKTYGGPIENKEYREYLRFSKINDSLVTEIYSFLEECYKIAGFSEMLDAETTRLYYIDSLLDNYGEKFLKYLNDMDYETLAVSGEAIAGKRNDEFKALEEQGFALFDNADIDTISSAKAVNDELMELYRPNDSINKEIDKINIVIEKHNAKLQKLRSYIDSLNDWDNRFEKESKVFASNCNSFFSRNSGKALNPLMCFEKWSLFRKAYIMKLDGWALLGDSYRHNENILKMKAEEKEITLKTLKLKKLKEEYIKRYNLLKSKFRQFNGD